MRVPNQAFAGAADQSSAVQRGDSFDAFRSRYWPLVRPVGRVIELSDAQFELQMTKNLFSAPERTWPEGAKNALCAVDELRQSLSDDELDVLARELRTHIEHQFLNGRFHEAYFDSLLELALRLIHAGVRVAQLATIYQRIEKRALAEAAKLDVDASETLRPQMRAFSRAITIELRQMQHFFFGYANAAAAENSGKLLVFSRMPSEKERAA